MVPARIYFMIAVVMENRGKGVDYYFLPTGSSGKLLVGNPA